LSFQKIFTEIVVISPIVGFTIGVIRFKRLDKASLAIWLLCGVAFVISVYSHWQWKFKINNFPSLHLLTVLEFLLASAFYYFSFPSRLQKRAVLFIALLFTAFTLYNSFYIQHLLMNNSNARGLEAFLLSLFSITMYYNILNSKVFVKLESLPHFWINTAFFIYFGNAQIGFLFFNHLVESDLSLAKRMWEIHRAICFVYYLLLGLGLWKKK
jgi:hypothetical protein